MILCSLGSYQLYYVDIIDALAAITCNYTIERRVLMYIKFS